MILRPATIFLPLLALLFHFGALADAPPQEPEAAASAPEMAMPAASTAAVPQDSAPAAATAHSLATRQMPKLLLNWNCGSCEHNDKVLPLIEQEYAKQAQAKGYVISDAETAELSITEYRQRPPAMRAMFGVFAGKDILRTVVRFRDKSFVAGDYMANAWQGMNSLCASVAKKAIEQIVPTLPAQP